MSRPPGEITLADVVDVFESAEEPAECAVADSPWGAALVDVCCESVALAANGWQGSTLAELVDRAAWASARCCIS